MGPKQLKTVLVKMMKAGFPCMIKGPPGCGKSDIVTQAAELLKYELVLTHPVVSDPTDYKGLPGVIEDKNGNKHAEFLPFGDLRAMLEAKRPTIVFIDDLGQAPAVVQAACMQLILARRINGHCVSEHIRFVAATNRREDRAGVTGILEPVKSRFHAILDLEVDKDDWTEWALEHDIPMEIIGWINFRPEMLTKWTATADIVNGPCPRTVAHAGDLLKIGLTDLETLKGAVGEGAATDLCGFLKYFGQLPNIDALILNPDKAEVPDDLSAQYAIVAALVGKITPGNCERILRYAARLPMDFNALLVRDAIRREPKVKDTKAFTQWCVVHKDVLL